MINGVQIGSDSIELTHLDFADDKLLFIPNNSATLMNCSRLLQCFKIMIGLSINFANSNLVGWGTNTQWIEYISKEIGCKARKLPITYLGLPLGSN